MKIKYFPIIDGSLIDYDTFLTYLSREIYLKTDDEIRNKNLLLENLKKEVSTLKNNIINLKKTYQALSSDLSREKALSRVLGLIEILHKEDILIGKDRQKVKNVLNGIENRDFEYLRNLEQKLIIYLPEKYSK
jgi:hypothetical protein